MRGILDILSEMAELGAKVEFSDNGLEKLERIIEKENEYNLQEKKKEMKNNETENV